MKIKKVGEIPSNSQPEDHPNIENSSIQSDTANNQKEISQAKNKSNKKTIIFSAIGLFLVILIIIIYFFVINNDGVNLNNTSSADSLKLKELELKEKELKLKEQQLGNSQTKSSQQNNSNQQIEVIQTVAPSKVREWINALGNRDFSKAFYMISPTKRGDYSKFSSPKGYGGITSTTIYDCYTENYGSCYAEVIADYESIDPANRSGRYKQKFYINNCSGIWEITDMKTLNIQFY